MGFNGIGLTAPKLRALAPGLALAMLAAACSSSVTTAGATVAAATEAGPAVTGAANPASSLGPATQTLTLAGPAGHAGAVSGSGIRCNQPSTTNLLINVIGNTEDPGIGANIIVSPGKVSVRYATGSGSTYAERDFEGTGVTNFDAGKGASIQSPLTEVPTTDSHGTLGVLTAISGTIDCGNQKPGSTNFTITGSTLKGPISGSLTQANVECISSVANGQAVSIMALGTLGSAQTLVIIYVWHDSFSVSTDGFFGNSVTGTATFTGTGAHLDGTAVQQVAAGVSPPPFSIVVRGDAICGTSISN